MTKVKSRDINMVEGPLFKNIIFYTIPIILTSLLQLLFNAADLVVVGQFCGDIMVAAVGNAGTVTSLLVNLFAGFAAGTSVAVAQAIGAKKDEDVHRVVHTAIPTALICGVIITVVGMIFSEPLLRLMNTPENVLPLSALYLRIYFAGAIFMMLYNFCSAILRAAGDTKTPLIFLTLSGILNVVLNIIFVTLFDMDVDGVALATTISQAVSAILVAIILIRRTDACKLIISKMRIYKKQLGAILYIGLPAGLQNALFSISNVFIQSSINPFGDVLMSGNAAAGTIEGFMYVFLNGFMQSSLNFIGQNAGAKKYDRVKKIFTICLGCVFVIGIVLSTTVYLLGSSLLSIYAKSPEAIGWGMVRFTYVCFAYAFCGMMEVTTGALRGLKAAIIPMITSVLGVCGIRIAWICTIFQIPQFHTPQCLYLSYSISWAVTFFVQAIAFIVVFNKQKKQSLATI